MLSLILGLMLGFLATVILIKLLIDTQNFYFPSSSWTPADIDGLICWYTVGDSGLVDMLLVKEQNAIIKYLGERYGIPVKEIKE